MQSIHIASDHTGVDLKTTLAEHLGKKGFTVINHGTDSSDSCDYPVLAHKLCAAVEASGEPGILICGTGIGVAMSANKVPGIRAAQTHDTFSAERAAKSNNAHIITFGARVIGPELAKTVLNAWLVSEFDPQGPSAGNVAAVDELDRKYRK